MESNGFDNKMMEKQNVQRARFLARETLTLLGRAEKELKRARNWGIYDILGGGFFVSWIKRNKAKKAESLLVEIKGNLNKLQKLVKGISTENAPRLDVSEFQWFLDIAVDNVLTDWLTQKKIQQSLREVERISTQINRLLTSLQ